MTVLMLLRDFELSRKICILTVDMNFFLRTKGAMEPGDINVRKLKFYHKKVLDKNNYLVLLNML